MEIFRKRDVGERSRKWFVCFKKKGKIDNQAGAVAIKASAFYQEISRLTYVHHGIFVFGEQVMQTNLWYHAKGKEYREKGSKYFYMTDSFYEAVV